MGSALGSRSSSDEEEGWGEVQYKVGQSKQMRIADLSDVKIGPKYVTPIPLIICVPFNFSSV